MQVRSRLPRIADDAFQRARLTVVPRRRTQAARMPFVALVSMVLLGGVVGLLLFNTSMQQASFASTALQTQADTLAARQQALEMDLDRLRDPQRIAASAQRLGMVQACSPAFLSLGTGKVTGQPCPGTAVQPFRINPLPPAKPAALTPHRHVVYVDPPPASTSGSTAGTSGTAGKSGGDTGSQSTASGRGDGKKNQ